MADAKRALGEIKRKIQSNGKPAEVTELDLTQIQIGKLTPPMKALIESCKNIEMLSMAECDLTSLENFPKLDKLVQLDVSSNSLTDNDMKTIATQCPKVATLSIGDNNIKCVNSIEHLKALKGLQILNCDDNPVASQPTYSKAAFKTFPKLKYLDSKDKEGNEVTFDGMNEDEEEEEEAGSDEEEDGEEADEQEEDEEGGSQQGMGSGSDEQFDEQDLPQDDDEQYQKVGIKPKKRTK